MSTFEKKDVIEFIRKHPSMYMSMDESPLYEKLLIGIIYDILSLDVYDFSAARKDQWIFIGSNEDWLKKGKFLEGTTKTLFERVFPLVEAGQNNIRHEVVLRAFAKEIVLFGEEGCTHITPNGKPVDNWIIETCKGLNKSRVVAFTT
jgi:hypothetical protein